MIWLMNLNELFVKLFYKMVHFICPSPLQISISYKSIDFIIKAFHLGFELIFKIHYVE
jgi:hypothetical protein